MGEAGDGPSAPAWMMSRRQLLGGGVVGAAGLALDGSFRPAPAGASTPGPGRPGRLTVDGLVDPVGLAADDVFFGWLVDDDRRGARQGAYRIRVHGPQVGRRGAPMVWDSGRVASARQAFVAYRGPPLAPDAAYRWTVQTWDGEDRPSPPSAPSRFTTGLGNHHWVASWIGRDAPVAAEPDQYTYARTEFRLRRGTVLFAQAHVSGDQQYELFLNGTRAGKGQAYSYPDSKYYETWDVTGLVRPGAANAVGILSNWQGPTKGHPAGRPGVIAELTVHYAGGRVERVATDPTWRVLPGAWLPGTQRDLEGDLVDFTEHVNGPAQPLGWDLPGFDDRGWSDAVDLGRAPTTPWTRLLPVRTRVVEEPVPAVSLTTLASGAVVADFGRVYAAVPTVRFRRGVAGRTVTMRAGYLLDQPSPGRPVDGVPGQVSTAHGTQHTDMSYSYVQRGGDEEFHPFDYLGFRYFQIDDPGEELTPADVVARTRHTAPPPWAPATFSSSEPVIDAIFGLALHSALFTAQEQFIDTPTREKGPWLFDGFNESCTAMAGLGEQNLTRKSLLEFAQSQQRYWPNGAVNKIYPTGLGALDINESTEVYPEWVWQYWFHTGDRDLLDQVYPVLRRISDYVLRAVSPATGLVTALPATNVYYWFPTVTRLNVLGANVFGRTAQVAEALGRPAGEVDLQRHRRSALVSAINLRLTRPDGTYLDGRNADGSPTPGGSQTANACALAYQVVPPRHQATPQNAGEVVEAVGRSGLTAALVATLADADGPGWANILARGATFTWEVWNPSDANGDSMSHGWGSNVLVGLQRWLLGVRPTSAGFATVDVAPPPAGLDHARGTVPTPRGPIAVAWSRPTAARPHFALDLEMPANTRATVALPAAQAGSVTEGGHRLSRVHGVHLIGVSRGTARLEVGAGSYRFASTPGA
jgi:alpha-L-rhamnosidase